MNRVGVGRQLRPKPIDDTRLLVLATDDVRCSEAVDAMADAIEEWCGPC